MLTALSALLCSALAGDVSYRDEVLIGAALWTEGLLVQYEPGFRWKLYDSDHFLFADSHLSVVAHVESSPAYGSVGPVVYFEPIAFFDVTARLYARMYYGTFSSLLGSDDPGLVGTPENLNDMIDDGLRQAGYTAKLDIRPRLKAKVGPAIAMASLEYRHYFGVKGFRDKVPYFWNPAENLVMPGEGGGGLFITNVVGFYEIIEKPDEPYERFVWAGPVWTREWVPSTGDLNNRLGAVTMFRPMRGYPWPTMFLSVQPWLKSRFMDPVPPYIQIGAFWER